MVMSRVKATLDQTRPVQPAPYMAAVPSVCEMLGSTEPNSSAVGNAKSIADMASAWRTAVSAAARGSEHDSIL